MKSINAVWATLNRSCNLRCSFCYTNALNFDNKANMSIDDFKKIVNFCITGGIGHITLIGGEPTVYPHLAECIKILVENNITFTIVTNGILFNSEKYLQKLLDAGLSHCSMVSISVKETNEDFYEKVTGKRAYEMTYKAFKKMKELNIPSSFSFVITQDNVERYLDGLKKFIEISGDYYVGLSLCYDFNQTNTKDDLYLDKNSYFDLIKKFNKTVPELNKITEGKWNLQNGIPRCLIDDDDYELIRKHSTVGCQLIDGWGIVFDTDLSIIPCNSTYFTKIGKYGRDFNSYSEYVDFLNNTNAGRKLSYLRSLPNSFCLGCEMLKDCKGGCLAYWSQFNFNDAMKAKFKHNFPNACNLQNSFKNFVFYGTHGTSKKEAISILKTQVIDSSFNISLNQKLNFAFYLKPAYKKTDKNGYPVPLTYFVSKYGNDFDNLFPFDSGFYKKNIKYPSIVNFKIDSYSSMLGLIAHYYKTLPMYYFGKFAKQNATLPKIEQLYFDLISKKDTRVIKNADERIKTMELSKIKPTSINNLVYILTNAQQFMTLKTLSPLHNYFIYNQNHFKNNLSIIAFLIYCSYGVFR